MERVEDTVLSAFRGAIEAKPHTAVYKMHKYFARRPWNVFSELIAHYSSPEEIVLDPFSGGGVTIVEALRLRRRAVGVDVNPLAVYITRMESSPLDIDQFKKAIATVSSNTKDYLLSLYSTRCPRCESKAYADWIEWDEPHHRIIRLKYCCITCGKPGLKRPSREDVLLADEVERNFMEKVVEQRLWFPETQIPLGDKTSSLIRKGVTHFHQLFTRRNLLALATLFKEIERGDSSETEFLKFAFSSSLKWVSRQSHLRGRIVEGWALHAYWIYPRTLEINVWNTFERRTRAIIRGKQYSNLELGDFYKPATHFEDLRADSNCLLLNTSSTKLPIPDNSIDVIVTDPPYGGNVNYGELSDFWWVWLQDKTVEKLGEAIINRSQNKSLEAYENILTSVFKECFRVLKPGRKFVSTFNSKDARVVTSFIIALTTAGFKINNEAVSYQNPIKAYSTTIHAMQIGAFAGDFIFTFTKPNQPDPALTNVNWHGLPNFKESLSQLISVNLTTEVTEAQLRERAYKLMIPFIAGAGDSSPAPETCREAADFFEEQIREHLSHFKNQRKMIIKSRKRNFRTTRRNH